MEGTTTINISRYVYVILMVATIIMYMHNVYVSLHTQYMSVLLQYRTTRAHKKEHVTEWAKNHGKNCEESY